MGAITQKKIGSEDVGCWFDGSHSSTIDLDRRIVELAESWGFVPSDPNWIGDENNDWEGLDALDYLNNEVLRNNDYCSDGLLYLTVDDNSLYLEKLEDN